MLALATPIPRTLVNKIYCSSNKNSHFKGSSRSYCSHCCSREQVLSGEEAAPPLAEYSIEKFLN